MILHVDIFTSGEVILVHVLKAKGGMDLNIDCCTWPVITFLPEGGEPSCP